MRLLLLVLVVACTPAEEGETDALGECDHTGLATASEEFTFVTGYDVVVYGATTAETPYDGLNLELYLGLGAPSEPGTHSFTGETYADCHTCLTLARACTTTSDCAQDFLADSGTLTLTAFDPEDGGSFAGHLSDVRLVEVEIDEATWDSTVVPGGEVWCLEEHAFSGVLQ